MSKLSDFGKFLAKYALEANAIAAGFRGIVENLSLERQDKANVLEVISKLEETAKNVANAATGFKEAKITVRKSDVEDAVNKALPALVAAELKRLGIVEATQVAGEAATGTGPDNA